jgi:hypothetical protein
MNRHERRATTARARNDARMVHFLIRKTAKELAGAFYEFQAVKSERFYKLNGNVTDFVDENWPNFVLISKQVLTQCLTSGNLTDSEKMDIYEALLDDATLPYSPQETQVVNLPN